jgi:hypothetical protein
MKSSDQLRTYGEAGEWTRNDCLLTFPMIVRAFRDSGNRGWAALVDSGQLDDFIRLIDVGPFLPAELKRLLSSSS